MALTVPLSEIVERSSNRLLGKHESWDRVLLRDVATVLNGYAFKSSEFSNSGGVPLIRIRDVGKDRSETTYLGEYDPRYVVEPGDLVVGMDGDFNCARWRGPRGLLNQRVCKITLKSDIYLPKFLDYTLPGYLKAINDVTSSVTVKHLSSKSIEEIPLPLPPKELQQRLVAEIEKQFSRLDEAVANLRRVKANLKRYKAAVLKVAVEGKLTEEWRQQHSDVESASKLLERILAARRQKWTDKGKYKEPLAPETEGLLRLPNAWKWVSIAQLYQVKYGLSEPLSKTSPNTSDDIPVLRIANVTKDGRLHVDDLKYFSLTKSARQKLLLRKGDLLFNWRNAPNLIGKTAVFTLDGEFVNASFLLRLRPPLPTEDGRFVWLFLNYLRIRGYFGLICNAAVNQSNFNASRTATIPVPLPPLAEQHAIVAEVESRTSVIDELEAAVETNLTRADHLRQSILGQALSGKLLFNGLRG